MNMCPDCATPGLCRAVNYDCGHDKPREATTVEKKTNPADNPAHYAVQKLWRETCNNIKATEVEIERSKLSLADEERYLITLRHTRQQLENHAAHHGWELSS